MENGFEIVVGPLIEIIVTVHIPVNRPGLAGLAETIDGVTLLYFFGKRPIEERYANSWRRFVCAVDVYVQVVHEIRRGTPPN